MILTLRGTQRKLVSFNKLLCSSFNCLRVSGLWEGVSGLFTVCFDDNGIICVVW